jgi:cell division protein FtsZ
MLEFDLPQEQSSIIKVIGVGGGGGNAVNHMFRQHIEGVNFIICNTDAQALSNSKISNRIQLGPQLTSGLGAGANPEIGRQATEESLEEIRKILEVNTKMVFITAGMGGGTGTGGAPIIAKMCRDSGVRLTVGIVTTPFAYEGKKRQMQAEEGIKQLRQYVDTLLIISNDKLRHQFGNLKMREAFEKADNVLATAAKCITDVITTTGQINVDFADICTVMKNGGVAILGSAAASGENRAQRAIEDALNSPLLNDSDISGAAWILLNVNSAEGEYEFTMDELEVIQSHLLSQAGKNTDVILGTGYDNSLGDAIGITLIATNFENKNPVAKSAVSQFEKTTEDKVIVTLDEATPVQNVFTASTADATMEEETPMIELEPKVQKSDELIYVDDAPMSNVEDVAAPESKAENDYFVYDLFANAHQPVVPTEPEIESQSTPVNAAEDTEEDAFYSPAIPSSDRVMQMPDVETEKEQASNFGNYPLSIPVNIYDEPKEDEKEMPDVFTAIPQFDAENKEDEMRMYEKSENAAERKELLSENIRTSLLQTENTEPDEQEIQRQKRLERVQRLRNLSFNVNVNDPNNEFEIVPAYLRRNMELHQSSQHSQVENYYSKLEVAPDDKNQGPINTINAFLDGKNPC